MKTVLVFKTSVTRNNEVSLLRPLLNDLINKEGRWNFDLEDCDKILRVETVKPKPEAVVSALKFKGFRCEELL
ncbi:hypothetical protein WIW50_08145 [Flavobacteriaceae bacterium 3-367]|uniref:hypothetical protein n=1 Tax=Eudoraea algarum TaxID=3417568 RepID=UPI003270548C